MKKVGILFDNISGNTGDVAIGLSLVKILSGLGVEFDLLYPGNFDPADYDTVVIGGGHVLRAGSDIFYDKFKVPGPHILNAAGLSGSPDDLGYLDDYKYVTVRSNGDKAKLSYLKKKVRVVPCTSMLLRGLEDFRLFPEKPCIGIHLSPGSIKKQEAGAFIRWVSSLPFTVYFIPVTHYNWDHSYMRTFSPGIRNSILLPRLKPLEILALMGRMDYNISCSLHGAIFSYIHNRPFILYDSDEKMRNFMEDRGLQRHLFKDFEGMSAAFGRLREEEPDYGKSFSADLAALEKHVERLASHLPGPSPRRPGDAVARESRHPGKLRLLALRMQFEASNYRIRLSGLNHVLARPFSR